MFAQSINRGKKMEIVNVDTIGYTICLILIAISWEYIQHTGKRKN